MTTIYKCSTEEAAGLWEVVEPYLAKALKSAPPYWRIEHLKQMTLDGDYVLWVCMVDGQVRGCALSELVRHWDVLICNVPWIGGRGMKLWFSELQGIIEKWARTAGAEYLGGAGRRGWIRTAGMKEIGTILIKEL